MSRYMKNAVVWVLYGLKYEVKTTEDREHLEEMSGTLNSLSMIFDPSGDWAVVGRTLASLALDECPIADMDQMFPKDEVKVQTALKKANLPDGGKLGYWLVADYD